MPRKTSNQTGLFEPYTRARPGDPDTSHALVRHWVDQGLSSRAARLLANDGFEDLAALRASGHWLLIPRCGTKMRGEIARLLTRMEGREHG